MQIGKQLEREQIPNPSNHYYRKYGKETTGLDLSRPYRWSATTVASILEDETHLGHTVNLRSTTISYKNKKRLSARCQSSFGLRTPTSRWRTGRPGRSCRTSESTSGAVPTSQSRICSPAWCTAPTAAGRWCATERTRWTRSRTTSGAPLDCSKSFPMIGAGALASLFLPSSYASPSASRSFITR